MGKKEHKFLLVDDEQDVLILVKEFLELYDQQVDTATSAKEALEKFSNGNYDIVVSDFEMPQMSGVDLAKTIKEKHGDVNFYLISGYAQILSDEEMNEYGIKGILEKPFKMDEIERIIPE